MAEELEFWTRLGFPPTLAFELSDGRLGYAHQKNDEVIGDIKYARFIAAVVFDGRRPQAFSEYKVPADLVLRIEPFTPARTATLGDFLRSLKEGLFGRGGEK